MAGIADYLKQILSARYGKDVRQAIHNGIRQCYEDGKAGVTDLIAREMAEEAESIAKGRNQARVFADTDAMNAWLSDAANMGVAQKGDNLYIVALDVPDWWIAEVLEEPNESGMYYEIAQLETQKVDLTTIETAIQKNAEDIATANSNLETVITENSNAYLDFSIIKNAYQFTIVVNASNKTGFASGQSYNIGNVGFTLKKSLNKTIFIKDGVTATLGIGSGGAVNLTCHSVVTAGTWLMFNETYTI